MAGQFLSDASGYESTEFDTKIPSLSDQADIVEAFKLYHYGIDDYDGSQPPSADSIHAHLKDINDRLNTVETIPSVTLSGTTNEVVVSASVGSVTIGLPDDVTITDDLTVGDDALINGDLTVQGNLVVSGSTTFVNTSSLSVTDPMVILATNNTGDTLDIGLVGKYVESASTKWTGIVRDDTDSVWKLFSNVSSSPTTQMSFIGADYDNLKIGSLDAVTQVTTVDLNSTNLIVTGVSDIRIPANSQSGSSYTLASSDVGKLVEMSNASSNTVTVPPNSSVPISVGSQIVVVQTGTGQTTLAAGSGVTVNATPGLKLRAQWSSATLVKRSTDSWVAFGDLIS